MHEDLQEMAGEIQRQYRSVIREFRIEPVEDGLVLHGFAYLFYGKQVALSEVQRRSSRPIVANRIVVA